MKRLWQRRRFSVFATWGAIYLLFLFGVSCSGQPQSTEDYARPLQDLEMNANQVQAMAFEGDRDLWVGNRDGVLRIDIANRDTRLFEEVDCPQIFTTSVGVWCNTGNHVDRYDGGQWNRFDLQVHSIVEATDGKIWAGADTGLALFDPALRSWKNVVHTGSATSPRFTFKTGSGIFLSFQSNDGALWFYSYNEDYLGVTRWTPTSHSTWLPAGDHAMVRPILEASNSEIWGAGDEGAIARWDGRDWEVWHPFRLNPAVIAIIESQDGAIWALGIADGIGRWDGQRWRVWSRDANILQACPGGSRGSQCFETIADVDYYPADGLGKELSDGVRLTLTSLAETEDGDIWVGTTREGVSRWDGSEWRNYTADDGLSSEIITALVKGADGTLWAGTWGGGVNYYDHDADRWCQFP